MADQVTGRRDRDAATERQNEGYDEAARGGPGVPPSDVGVPHADDEAVGDEFDQQAREAANDVRRREHSAD